MGLGAVVIRGAREQGAAAVEMALILPVLLIVVFGIIDFGSLFNAQISLTQAAREGVRLGAIGEATSVEAMEARMQDAYFGIFGSEQPSAVEGSVSCGPEPDPEDSAELVASLEFTTPIGRFQPTLTAKAVMRCGG